MLQIMNICISGSLLLLLIMSSINCASPPWNLYILCFGSPTRVKLVLSFGKNMIPKRKEILPLQEWSILKLVRKIMLILLTNFFMEINAEGSSRSCSLINTLKQESISKSFSSSINFSWSCISLFTFNGRRAVWIFFFFSISRWLRIMFFCYPKE